jgi:chromosome segregation ATPase
MSTLLTLFKASKKLYEDFEYSRPLTNIPFINSYKAFKLDDKQVSDPKEDNAIEEFIQTLAQDPAVEKSNRLKNLVKILQACIAKTDSATLQTNLTTLREENKTFFGTQPFYTDYEHALDDFINQKLLLERHQEALAALRDEIAKKDAAFTTVKTETAQIASILKEVSAKLDKETNHNQELIAQCEEQDTVIQALKRDFYAAQSELTRKYYLVQSLTLRNNDYVDTIAALRQEIETHKDTIEKLEGIESDLEHDLISAGYNLSETSQKLELSGKAHLETDSQLVKAEQIISELEKKIIDLRTMNQEKIDKIKVLEATIETHLGVNAKLQTMHTEALQQADLQLADVKAQAEESHRQLETQFKASLQGLESKIKQIETTSKENSQQFETKQRESETKVRDAHSRSAEIQRLLDKTKAEKATLQTRFDEEVSEHEKVIVTLTQQVNDITEAKKQSDAKSKVVFTQASSDIKGLSKERDELEKDLTASKGELNKTKIAAAALTKKSKDLTQANACLETKLAESETLRIASEEASTSIKESYDDLVPTFSSHTVKPASATARNDANTSGIVTGTPQTLYSTRKTTARKQQSNQPATAQDSWRNTNNYI